MPTLPFTAMFRERLDTGCFSMLENARACPFVQGRNFDFQEAEL